VAIKRWPSRALSSTISTLCRRLGQSAGQRRPVLLYTVGLTMAARIHLSTHLTARRRVLDRPRGPGCR
jgi:hypothetical protein